MTLPAPAQEVETRDVYLGFCCLEDRPARKWGDINTVRDAKEELGEGSRTVSCYLKVTGIPVAALTKLREKGGGWWQRRYLWGLAKEKSIVSNLSGLMAVKKALLPYMSVKVTQPVKDIPTVAWADLRGEVYDVVEQRLADAETELEATEEARG